ncbi:MAG: ester cyclase [Deltaproteobacteria bacterium]|nr:ester cyclase [Deltaproteobacteria bacterium]
MSLAENKALVRRLYEELWGRGNLAVVDECVARDYVNHQRTIDPHVDAPMSAVDICGAEIFKQLVQAWRRGFPDVETSVEEQIAEGDKVVTRWVSRGTHSGPWMQVPASGHSMVVEGISIDRVAGGKIVESWTNWDLLGLLEQIGASRDATGPG